jgi:hypothetical protein
VGLTTSLMGYTHIMRTAVDIETRLADALRVLLPLAVKDMPEWATDAALAERNRAYTEARFALDLYDEREPAAVMELSLPPVVVRAEHRGGALALASAS